MNIISRSGDGFPKIKNPENCFLCGHCVGVCESNAIFNSQFNYDEIKPMQHNISSDDMMSFLKMRRSCRHYQNKKVDKVILQKLIETAKMAPTVFNCEERGFVVISKKETLNKFRDKLYGSTKRGLKLIRLMTNKPMSLMLTKEAKEYFRRARLDLEMTLSNEGVGMDTYFHGAPHLILFTGIAKDPFGKDHALNAMHYFMSMAQSMGLGCCINGHVQDASKVVSKLIEVPDQQKIYCAITLGYPSVQYKNSVSRKSAEVIWDI